MLELAAITRNENLGESQYAWHGVSVFGSSFTRLMVHLSKIPNQPNGSLVFDGSLLCAYLQLFISSLTSARSAHEVLFSAANSRGCA